MSPNFLTHVSDTYAYTVAAACEAVCLWSGSRAGRRAAEVVHQIQTVEVGHREGPCLLAAEVREKNHMSERGDTGG